jgi:hypothetical protein
VSRWNRSCAGTGQEQDQRAVEQDHLVIVITEPKNHAVVVGEVLNHVAVVAVGVGATWKKVQEVVVVGVRWYDVSAQRPIKYRKWEPVNEK